MNTSRFARLTEVSPNTIRRWTEVYRDYLSPTATPAKGKTRTYTDMDLRVLYFVATLRDNGVEEPAILDRLEEMQSNGWANIPTLPDEWTNGANTMPVEVAVTKASQVAQLAVLQTELKHTQRELEQAHQRVEELEGTLEGLQGNLSASEERIRAVEAEKTAVQLELATAKGEVTRLEAELRAFGMAYGFGRGKPVSVAVIIGLALLAGALLVLLTFVVSRLIM